MGASWTRSSRRSGCSAFAEQELARAVRRFGGSYELSAPTRFLEGGGPAVQAVVPARGSRLERELGLRRAAFTCTSVPGEHVVGERGATPASSGCASSATTA